MRQRGLFPLRPQVRQISTGRKDELAGVRDDFRTWVVNTGGTEEPSETARGQAIGKGMVTITNPSGSSQAPVSRSGFNDDPAAT